MATLQGLSFAFPIPSQYTDCCRDGEGIPGYFRFFYTCADSNYVLWYK